MRLNIFRSALPLFLLAVGQTGSLAQSSTVKAKAAPPVSAPVSYREQVEPYLKAGCACHSADKHNGDLILDTPAQMFKGGATTHNKVVVPGNSKQSLIIAYMKGTKQPQMPIGGTPATPAQIALIAAWIDQGAKIDAVRPVFPYVPPVKSKIPIVHNARWGRNPIDNFILAKLEAKGLQPAPEAGKVTLMRRVYADLVGEPPTPEEADAFIKDTSPNAYEKLVDRLLEDKRYGERWARHWLDLVRYADTHGFENDGIRPRAWRYRDYVIRAFNADKPYDRFIKEQIAGDELYPDDPDAIVATGYARLSPWDELSTDHPQRWQDYLNDVTDTTGSVMLGLTVGCAKCHSHKYDRISIKDYYSLQSFFINTRMEESRLPGTDPYAAQTEPWRKQIEKLRAEEKAIREKYRSAAEAERQKTARPGEAVRVDDGDLDRALERADNNHEPGAEQDHRRKDRINDEIRSLEDKLRPLEPVAEVVKDNGKNAPAAHLLLRGNLGTPGEEVHPAFIESLCASKEAVDAVVSAPAGDRSSGRRTALANWIASPANPMTARVMVNRIWQHHFGIGIVGTPSDFGRNGDHATHPELLDWLAIKFVEDGWSLKKMHRLMLTSSAYRQSTQVSPLSAKLDPENHLLSHMNRIRLEGEALRDSILATSGRLNPEMYGPGVYPHVSDEVLATGSTHKWGNSPEAQGLRRTIYVFQRRSLVLPIVEAFDAADMNNTCPRRAATTIAPQALALFNGEFSRSESVHIAERVIKDAGADLEKQITRAYELTLIRKPTASQMALAKAFLIKQTQLPSAASQAVRTAAASNAAPAVSEAQSAALAELCHVLINTNEFIYLD
jgi:Protein of unknown function (DUF1553)/Protein of unknown function (DUF1549)/Planctomycete cytochrome C